MLKLLAMSLLWNRLPSEVLHIEDSYAAWCLDEAVYYLYCLMREEETPEEEAPTKLPRDVLESLRGKGGTSIEGAFNGG